MRFHFITVSIKENVQYSRFDLTLLTLHHICTGHCFTLVYKVFRELNFLIIEMELYQLHLKN